MFCVNRGRGLFQDLSLPRTLIARLAKGVLPPNTQIQKDAVTAISKSATVFVGFIADEYVLPISFFFRRITFERSSGPCRVHCPELDSTTELLPDSFRHGDRDRVWPTGTVPSSLSGVVPVSCRSDAV